MSYNFGVLLMELWLKNYIESWDQTLGMRLFGLWVLTCWPLGPTSRWPRKIKIHNSIIWIRGRNHAILHEKLHKVLGSSHWNHGLNGELCPEYFWNGPRFFCCSPPPAPQEQAMFHDPKRVSNEIFQRNLFLQPRSFPN